LDIGVFAHPNLEPIDTQISFAGAQRRAAYFCERRIDQITDGIRTRGKNHSNQRDDTRANKQTHVLFLPSSIDLDVSRRSGDKI
jgi:hypothetical protein